MANSLDQTLTLHLLVEYLYSGNAGFIEETKHLEPIDIDQIRSILRQRFNIDLGEKPEEWIRWFLDTPGQASEFDRNTLVHIVKSKKETDPFVSRSRKGDD